MRAAAIVLAGGTSRRFGSDKLQHTLAPTLQALPPTWPVVCVGPERELALPSLTWAREDPPLSGPLAGVAAGVRALESVRPDWEVAAVVAGDMPQVGPVLPRLVEALSGDAAVAAACLVDGQGFRQPLAAVYRRAWLEAVTASDVAGRPARLLVRDAAVVEVSDAAAAVDVDTPGDLDALAPPE